MIIDILQHTPVWVFGLFFLLVLGIKQSKDRLVSRQMLLPLPIGMIALSYAGIVSSFADSTLALSLWLLSLLAVMLTISRYAPVKGVSYQADSGKCQMVGSWLPLTLIMAIFFTKYVVGIVQAMHPALLTMPLVIMLLSCLYGGFSGVFAGRAASMWRQAVIKPELTQS